MKKKRWPTPLERETKETEEANIQRNQVVKGEPGRGRRLHSPMLASAELTANQLFLRPVGWHTCHSIIHPWYRTEPIFCHHPPISAIGLWIYFVKLDDLTSYHIHVFFVNILYWGSDCQRHPSFNYLFFFLEQNFFLLLLNLLCFISLNFWE